ncbi:nucleotide-binding domain-containing protein [uncultured Selenomonas sp.]|uniref:nucleotide-binding domain-containing protein n=1 Tax=uncultured Selenomonas sp. TaxID=159275 RepID=UPI0028E8C395|nr:hypothetical protein [uncultured Selenomonas sp.]
MALKEDFETFCSNIQLDNRSDMEKSAGEIAKKLNKHYYGLAEDTSSHLYIVGSVGRQTAIKDSSDLDIIFDLPTSVYNRFNAYEKNGQSSLLQEVKQVMKERYSRTEVSGDGQVVVIEFTKYTVELVPGFKQSDNRFKYPDTHDGGKWKYTDPLSEQDECANCNDKSNGIYYDFCHIMRSWKNTIGFEFGGLLIDTLVYNHFEERDNYANCGYVDYLTILQKLFDYLKGKNKDQSYWYAVGSNQQISNSGSGAFVTKAKKAASKIADAISNKEDMNSVLREVLGTEFPAVAKAVAKLYETSSLCFHNTEQFIEKMLPVDIRYSLQLECRVTQDGWRDFFLREFVRDGGILRRNKSLDFFINNTNCPEPYSIYWKVRNVGRVAEEKDLIRGQIRCTNSTHQKEHTDFQGGHYVECYLVKNGVCVAKDRIDVPIGTV